MSEGSGRQEMERRLIEKSIEDESFRQKLLEDPKGAVEQELGTRLPEVTCACTRISDYGVRDLQPEVQSVGTKGVGRFPLQM